MKPITGLNKQIIATGAFVSFSLAAMILSGCGTSNSGSGTAASNSSGSALNNGALQMTSGWTTVAVSGGLQFYGSGGVAPYTFSILSGPPDASINPTTGLLTAGVSLGTVEVQVQDSVQSTAYASITIVAAEGATMAAATSLTVFGSDWVANNAVDRLASTAFASAFYSSNQNTAGEYLTAYIAGKQQSVSAVYMTARMLNGQPIGFPVSYTVNIGNTQTGGWIDVGTFTAQPDANGNLRLALPQSYTTFGVQIVPVVFGPDGYTSYALEMAELSVGN